MLVKYITFNDTLLKYATIYYRNDDNFCLLRINLHDQDFFHLMVHLYFCHSPYFATISPSLFAVCNIFFFIYTNIIIRKKDTCPRWESNPRRLGLRSSALPLR